MNGTADERGLMFAGSGWEMELAGVSALDRSAGDDLEAGIGLHDARVPALRGGFGRREAGGVLSNRLAACPKRDDAKRRPWLIGGLRRGDHRHSIR